MKASAVSATSRHPWSMTSECPRLGISWISVTAGVFARLFLVARANDPRGHHLCDEAAEGMADDGGLRLELTDGVNVVIRDLLDALVGKDLRVVLGLLNGVRVIGPARRERGVALLFEQRAPIVPAAG